MKGSYTMTLEELIDLHYDELNENDLYIWQYIFHHKAECQKMSIQDLAHTCNVSHSSIIRFAKKLTLDGYSELKVYIKWSLRGTSNYDQNTLRQAVKDMQGAIEMMDHCDFDDICAIIDKSSRIFIYPTGDVQFHMAEEMKRSFVYCRKIMHIIDGRSELDNVLNRAVKTNAFIILSLSGDNEMAVTLAKVLQRMHIASIGVAMDNGNLLSKNCDQFIGFKTNFFETGKFQRRYCTTSQMFVIAEMLFLKYLEYIMLAEKRVN